MMKFNIYSVLLVLSIATGAVIAVEDPGFTIKKYGYETRMAADCALEVFDSIFKTGIVTNKCCQELRVLGQIFHNAFVLKSLQNLEFKNKNSSMILAKSKQVWNKYALVSLIPSPV
ncbi:hypothetical protein SLEP1_g53007 [Rubroshorea leprosula]|uniref:Prolamin-like domain-containing protein n=1 Tax=Rubroshorea leprosula TaxID=152421 RepID=A0AAV5MBI0_9ROSI|nr:hypothetical protein SLEP1_g53007 [Rubroshorea leprosula]